METTGEPVAARLPAGPAAEGRRLPAEVGSPALTRLTDLAARLLGAQARVQVREAGLPRAVGPVALEDALCAATVAAGGPLLVGDTRTDERVAALPAVAAGQVRSYLGVPLRGASGEVLGVLCALAERPRAWSAYDVALLEELAGAVVAQLELQALSARYRAGQLRWDLAIEAAGIGSFDWDLRTGRVALDERMQALLGHPPAPAAQTAEEMLARVHPVDRPAVDAAVEQALRTGRDLRVEYRVRRPDGQHRWLAARGRAVAGPDGAAAQLVGTAHDVSELRTARDDAARLLETMATGFIAVDAGWVVTYVNAEAAGVLGTARGALLGHRLWDLFPGLRDGESGRAYERAVTTGQAVQLEAYYDHLQRWYDVRAVPSADGLALYFLDVTGRRADQARAEAASARLEVLASVSAELADAGLEVEDAVARLAQVVVPVLADWCLVSLVSGSDGLRDVGWWHADPALRPLVETYTLHRLEGRTDLGPVQRARESQRPVVVEAGLTAAVLPALGCEVARSALRQLAPESAVVVPLIARGQMAGVLTLLRGPGRPAASDAEVVTATEVGARAALALDNARLYAEQRGLAEGLQRSLLTTPPEPDRCQIAVRYVPAAEAASVGGDWFDSFLQADGATVLVIGDVMGHDTVSAAAMGQLRSLLRGIAWHGGGAPAAVLCGLDAAMRGLQVDTTASAVVARLEQSGDERQRGLTRLRWSNAGHPPPLALHADGTVSVLSGDDTDLLLGIDPDIPRTESVTELHEGSTVLLYTDGLIERRGQDLDQGLALLRATLAGLADVPLEELCDVLLARMLPDDAEDDVALVAVRLHPEDRPRPAGPAPVPPAVR